MPRQLAIALVIVLATLAPALSYADGPTRVTEQLDFSFTSGFWTRTCGFPVVQSIQGTLHIDLFTGRDGSVREIDTFSSMSFQLSARADLRVSRRCPRRRPQRRHGARSASTGSRAARSTSATGSSA